MPEVRDTARIRDISGRSISHEIPNPDDPTAMVEYAKLVWDRMINDDRLRGGAKVPRNGQPGRLWQGRIVKEVFYFLWPRLEDSVLVGKERDLEIRDAIMGYLKLCGMLKIDDPGTKRNAAVWWVAEHWQPMTVSSTSEVVESPGKTEESPSEEVGEYPCRVCGAMYDSVTKRGGHEYSTCRAVVAADGTVYSYGDPKYTPQYTTDVVMRVLENAEEPLSFNAVSGRAYAADPRVGKPMVRQILLELSSLGAIKTSTRGRSTLYELDRDEPISNEQFTAAVMTVTSGKTNEVSRLSDIKLPVDLAEAVDYAEHVIMTALGNMQAAQRSINGLAESVEGLRAELAEKDKTIEGLRAKLIHKASEAVDSAELEAVRTELGSTREELDAVKGERDTYKGQLDTLRSALAGITQH